MTVTWSLLIATATARAAQFGCLLTVLAPQAGAAGGQVEVVALRNRGGLTMAGLARVRQALLTEARGRYVSCFDDDDWPEPDMVPAVLAALARVPAADYVAFAHRYTQAPLTGCWLPVHTGLSLGGWWDSPAGLVRDITHINPVRTTLARACGGFTPAAGPEDRSYATRLRAVLAGRPETVIDRVLYHYRHDPASSVQYGTVPETPAGPLPAPPGPWFRWHPEST